jgi:hypothetical protein
VPESVLQVKFSAICQVLLSIMAAKVDSQSTALLKSVSFLSNKWNTQSYTLGNSKDEIKYVGNRHMVKLTIF